MSKKNKKQKKVPRNHKIPDLKITVNKKIGLPTLNFPCTQVTMNRPLRVLIFMGFFSIFALYVSHLIPFVPGGDSGELISSAYLLGIPHPPGYPLFNLLGKLFSLIPIQNVAWRVNLSSAVFQLGASICIYLSLYKLTKFWPAALLGSLFYSFSPLIWEYSLKAEVFPLNNLFASLILYLIVLSREYAVQYEAGLLDKQLYENKSRAMVYWTLFTCGLALTNHHTIILLAPGVLLALYAYNRTVLFRGPTLLLALGAFLLGLMVYLYIPIRAASMPYLNWDNPQTLSSFIQLVTRKDYGSFTLLSSTAAAFHNDEKYLIYLSDLWKQISPLGLIMTLFGIALLLLQKEKKLGIILLLFYLLSSFGFITLANVIRNDPLFLGVFQRFYMLSLVFVAFFIGLGVYFLQHLLLLYFKEKKIGLVLRGLILSITLLISLIPLKTIQSPSKVIHNFGKNILNSLEPNAVVFMEGDSSVSSLYYLQLVEGLRPDVVLLAKNLLVLPSYVQQMKRIYPTLNIPFVQMDNVMHPLVELVEANLDKRPIYYVGTINSLPGFGSDYKFLSTGLVTQITKHNIELREHVTRMQAIWATYDLSELNRIFPPSMFEKETVLQYGNAHFKLGLDYLYLGWDDLSLIEFTKALEINEGGLSAAYKNMGIIYAQRKNDPKNAIAHFKAYMKFNPQDKESNDNLLGYIQRYS